MLFINAYTCSKKNKKQKQLVNLRIVITSGKRDREIKCFTSKNYRKYLSETKDSMQNLI